MGEIRELKTANRKSDRVAIPVIIVLSVLVPVAVALLILFPDTFKADMGIERSTLPPLSYYYWVYSLLCERILRLTVFQ